jgi:hypothetical protein
VLDNRELLAAEAVEPENLAEHSLWVAFASTVHRQIRFAVSAVGPVRGEIAGIKRNTLSSAKSFVSDAGPAATSKIPLVPGGTDHDARPLIFGRSSIRTITDPFAGAAQIRHILTR